jgi:hypothetical protein
MSNVLRFSVVALAVLVGGAVVAQQDPPAKKEKEKAFTEHFFEEKADLGPTGKNPYFILEPGYVLELDDPKDKEHLVITVLEETKKIDGVECRIVEERETVDGKLKEVSRNFYAISKRTNGVYYFGEEVDDYKDGKVVGHPGAWIHGEKDARYGLMMPGVALVGARHYQEIAPGVALDRAEIDSVSETVEVPAGTFKNVLKVEETTPLEPGKGHKYYAPGVGLLRDGGLKLVKYGFPKK